MLAVRRVNKRCTVGGFKEKMGEPRNSRGCQRDFASDMSRLSFRWMRRAFGMRHEIGQGVIKMQLRVRRNKSMLSSRREEEARKEEELSSCEVK